MTHRISSGGDLCIELIPSFGGIKHSRLNGRHAEILQHHVDQSQWLLYVHLSLIVRCNSGIHRCKLKLG
jgi:hypothetical protein